MPVAKPRSVGNEGPERDDTRLQDRIDAQRLLQFTPKLILSRACEHLARKSLIEATPGNNLSKQSSRSSSTTSGTWSVRVQRGLYTAETMQQSNIVGAGAWPFGLASRASDSWRHRGLRRDHPVPNHRACHELDELERTQAVDSESSTTAGE